MTPTRGTCSCDTTPPSDSHNYYTLRTRHQANASSIIVSTWQSYYTTQNWQQGRKRDIIGNISVRLTDIPHTTSSYPEDQPLHISAAQPHTWHHRTSKGTKTNFFSKFLPTVAVLKEFELKQVIVKISLRRWMSKLKYNVIQYLR